MDTPDLLMRHINHFYTTKSNVSECAEALRLHGIRVCSFENLAANSDAARSLSLFDVTLRQILDTIIEGNAGYRWDEPGNGLINLFPEISILDSQVPEVKIRSKDIWTVLEDDLKIHTLGIILLKEFDSPGGFNVSLDLEQSDLKTALNKIVAGLKQLVWHISGQPGAYYLSFTDVPVVSRT